MPVNTHFSLPFRIYTFDSLTGYPPFWPRFHSILPVTPDKFLENALKETTCFIHYQPTISNSTCNINNVYSFIVLECIINAMIVAVQGSVPPIAYQVCHYTWSIHFPPPQPITLRSNLMLSPSFSVFHAIVLQEVFQILVFIFGLFSYSISSSNYAALNPGVFSDYYE
jgi:hypothetical protein